MLRAGLKYIWRRFWEIQREPMTFDVMVGGLIYLFVFIYLIMAILQLGGWLFSNRGLLQ